VSIATRSRGRAQPIRMQVSFELKTFLRFLPFLNLGVNPISIGILNNQPTQYRTFTPLFRKLTDKKKPKHPFYSCVQIPSLMYMRSVVRVESRGFCTYLPRPDAHLLIISTLLGVSDGVKNSRDFRILHSDHIWYSNKDFSLANFEIHVNSRHSAVITDNP